MDSQHACPPRSATSLLSLRGVRKAFGAVVALDGV